MSLRAIHDFELSLLAPCLAMSARGIRVDEPRRLAMIADLDAMKAPLAAQAREIVVTELLLAKLDGLDNGFAGRFPFKKHLFQEKWTCTCCRGGGAKRLACWTCAGLTQDQGRLKANKGKLMPCSVCGGVGKGTNLTFNPDSPEQVKIVLHELLKLPKRLVKGKVSTDEDSLKSLLVVADTEVARSLIGVLLKLGKAGTMREILVRLEPGPDGRIRTFMNPAGTETGRFSHSESFLVRSTNLANLPKREVSDARFDVRRILVPDDGMVFVEADLSGAEAWVTAACCGDTALLAKLRTPGFKLHADTGAGIFGLKAADVKKDSPPYVLGKMANHALNYGMQWLTFQKNVNAEADKTEVSIDAKLAKKICYEYHVLRPTLDVWWRQVLRQLGAVGTLTTCFGRKRTFFGRDRNEMLRETHREAIAYEPQSTVADLLNRGLLRWWRQHDGKAGTLLAQIHDAVLLQVPRERAILACNLLRRCLEEEITVHGVKLTIPVDVTVSEHWGTWKGEA